MAKDPEHRYQSAREMADDLRNFKKLTIPAQLSFTALPKKRPGEYSGIEGDVTLILDTSKPLTVPGSSGRKKLIGIVIAVFFLVAAALFIYAQREPAKTATNDKEPTIGRNALTPTAKQPPVQASDKETGGQSKVRKNPIIADPAKANLNFTVLPWGEVFIDGKSMGASPPLKKIKLSPGRHQIEIKNATFSPYRKTVKLEAGESMKIRHKFN
jgi:serine/threonine-protein kinase